MARKHLYSCALLLAFLNVNSFAQNDSTSTEEDYSMYDNLNFVDEKAKSYCSNKIEGLSPSKLISVGYDFQGAHKLRSDGGISGPDLGYKSAHGMRISANVPVISRNDLIVQLSGNYWETRYVDDNPDRLRFPGKQTPYDAVHETLVTNGLRTLGLGATIFKPLNDIDFLLFQGSADLNGDWLWNDIMPMKYLKYSAAAIYGKRTNDRKMWGLGAVRTYRAGELNYIPVFLLNTTNSSNTWGSEILFPARAHVRRTFNARSLAFFGYELEGQSYRLWSSPERARDWEIRRSEIRLRFVYERSLKDFIWMSLQAGYRINYSYTVDELVDGKDFYRGFFGSQPFVLESRMTNPLYVNFSINLVSP